MHSLVSELYIKIRCQYIFMDAIHGVTWKYAKFPKIHATFFLRYPEAHEPFQRKKMEISLHPVLPYLRNSFAVWKFSGLLPSVLLANATCTRIWIWSTGGITVTVKTQLLWIKPVPVAPSPSQTSYGLFCDRTCVSAMIGRWLTFYAMAWPFKE